MMVRTWAAITYRRQCCTTLEGLFLFRGLSFPDSSVDAKEFLRAK